MKKLLFAIALALMTTVAVAQEKACVSPADWTSNQVAMAAKDGIKLDFVPMTGDALAKFIEAMMDNIKENGLDPGKYPAPYDLIVWAAFKFDGQDVVGLAGFKDGCNIDATVWSMEHFYKTMKKAVGPKEIGKGSI